MSEIDEVKHEAPTTSAPQTKEEEDKEEAKKKKKKEVLQPLEEEPLALNSEEICKYPPPIIGLTDENTLSLRMISTDYNHARFCNSDPKLYPIQLFIDLLTLFYRGSCSKSHLDGHV
jgi:hypothetical protein